MPLTDIDQRISEMIGLEVFLQYRSGTDPRKVLCHDTPCDSKDCLGRYSHDCETGKITRVRCNCQQCFEREREAAACL